MDFIDENYVTKLMEEKGYTEEVAEAIQTLQKQGFQKWLDPADEQRRFVFLKKKRPF